MSESTSSQPHRQAGQPAAPHSAEHPDGTGIPPGYHLEPVDPYGVEYPIDVPAGRPNELQAFDEFTSPQQQQQHGEVDTAARKINAAGVRFAPTDKEIIVSFLQPKLRGDGPESDAVVEADVYDKHPEYLTRDLGSDKCKEGFWYVFSRRDLKHSKGKRARRTTGDYGVWNGKTKNKEILGVGVGVDGKHPVIGHKRTLNYLELYGESRTGRLTDWKMEEFVSSNSDIAYSEDSERLNDWVLCKITRKNEKDGKARGKKAAVKGGDKGQGSSRGQEEEDEPQTSIGPQEDQQGAILLTEPLDFTLDPFLQYQEVSQGPTGSQEDEQGAGLLTEYGEYSPLV